jgi:hypothetical protein
MYDAQNQWISGRCQSSGILQTSKHVSETGSVSFFMRREGATYSVGSLPAPKDRNRFNF